ncbi:MAG TPA: helix-turn-helix transcriptional regulator, partial [Lapillicoccus sp.]
MTVVAAPAGFGKTTALTEWLATLPPAAPSVAWLSLDSRDNDPSLFWTYVVTAMRAAVDGLGSDALQLLLSSSPSTEAALASLINDLGGRPDDLLLILDDYHLVEAPGVHEGMTFLLEHRPPQLHVVLATRTDPPLPLARLRARGELVEVRAADLRFSIEESAAYLNGPMELRISEGDLVALDGRTEGWIAALQLAALSMQGRDDVSAFIAGFAGDDRYVVDYLGEEVLARQPAAVREFLLRTSILDRLTGPLCDAVTGRTGGRATLVALERANLFVVPLDAKRQWYRYHHLFADVLHAHLLDEHAQEMPELHRRASVWFEADGDSSQAIDHALAGGDTGRAADLMELAIPTMARERREAELARWVRALPREVVRNRPVLAVLLAGALTLVSDLDTVGERLSDVERLVRAEDGTWPVQPPPDLIIVDQEGYRSLPARIAMYRAALALADADLSGAVAHARQALSMAPPDDHLSRASGGALAGLASWTTGDLADAHAAYTESIAGLEKAGFIPDVLGCCITLGDIRRTQGRLTDALHT